MPKLRALPIAILALSLTSPCYARGGTGGGMGGMQGGFHDFRDGRFRGQAFFVHRPAFFVQRRAFFVHRPVFFVQRRAFFVHRPVFFAPSPVFFGFGFGGFAPFFPSAFPSPCCAFASPAVIYVLPPAVAPQAAPGVWAPLPPPAAAPQAVPAAPTPLPPPSATPPPATAAPPPARNAYYFCPASKGYYPYVATCAVAWRPVPTTPPQGQPRYAAAAPLGTVPRQASVRQASGSATPAAPPLASRPGS